jgi:hypothetical protein
VLDEQLVEVKRLIELPFYRRGEARLDIAEREREPEASARRPLELNMSEMERLASHMRLLWVRGGF